MASWYLLTFSNCLDIRVAVVIDLLTHWKCSNPSQVEGVLTTGSLAVFTLSSTDVLVGTNTWVLLLIEVEGVGYICDCLYERRRRKFHMKPYRPPGRISVAISKWTLLPKSATLQNSAHQNAREIDTPQSPTTTALYTRTLDTLAKCQISGSKQTDETLIASASPSISPAFNIQMKPHSRADHDFSKLNMSCYHLLPWYHRCWTLLQRKIRRELERHWRRDSF